MDPNAALAALRAAIADAVASPDHDTYAWHAAAIIEHFQALDEWLTGGGFLPASWERNHG
jgi:hypothetical protein